jgi:hypothetical protein
MSRDGRPFLISFEKLSKLTFTPNGVATTMNGDDLEATEALTILRGCNSQ